MVIAVRAHCNPLDIFHNIYQLFNKTLQYHTCVVPMMLLKIQMQQNVCVKHIYMYSLAEVTLRNPIIQMQIPRKLSHLLMRCK